MSSFSSLETTMIEDRTQEPVAPPLMPAPPQSLWRVTSEAPVHAMAPLVSRALRRGADDSVRSEPARVSAQTPLLVRLGQILIEYYRGISDGLAMWRQYGAPYDHDGAKVRSAARRALSDPSRSMRP
jgi:hypothetical protein